MRKNHKPEGIKYNKISKGAFLKFLLIKRFAIQKNIKRKPSKNFPKKTIQPIINIEVFGKALYKSKELKNIIILIVSPREYKDPNQNGKEMRVKPE